MGSILGSRGSPGGGHGNPFQYSCLENPTHRGAWWATVHGVAKSLTPLKKKKIQPKQTAWQKGTALCYRQQGLNKLLFDCLQWSEKVFFFFCSIFRPQCTAWGVLVPRPGIEPLPSALEGEWTFLTTWLPEMLQESFGSDCKVAPSSTKKNCSKNTKKWILFKVPMHVFADTGLHCTSKCSR